MQHGSRRAIAGMSLVVASSAAVLTGCSFSEDMMSGLGPEVETAPAHGQSSAQLPGPAQPGPQSNALVVTAQQRAYLDALRAAGVTPSSDLTALSIGSYVCQARAARQTDQAVWDFVAPLVRNDVSDADGDGDGDGADARAVVPPASEVHSATSEYIRIATDELC